MVDANGHVFSPSSGLTYLSSEGATTRFHLVNTAEGAYGHAGSVQQAGIVSVMGRTFQVIGVGPVSEPSNVIYGAVPRSEHGHVALYRLRYLVTYK